MEYYWKLKEFHSDYILEMCILNILSRKRIRIFPFQLDNRLISTKLGMNEKNPIGLRGFILFGFPNEERYSMKVVRSKSYCFK